MQGTSWLLRSFVLSRRKVWRRRGVGRRSGGWLVAASSAQASGAAESCRGSGGDGAGGWCAWFSHLVGNHGEPGSTGMADIDCVGPRGCLVGMGHVGSYADLGIAGRQADSFLECASGSVAGAVQGTGRTSVEGGRHAGRQFQEIPYGLIARLSDSWAARRDDNAGIPALLTTADPHHYATS